MSLFRANYGSFVPHIGALAALLASLSQSPAASVPQVGDTQTVPVITLALQVGSTGKESRRATYTPPPGWYIRSHSVTFIQRYGNTSFLVSTVPAGWASATKVYGADSFEQLVEVASKIHHVALQLARFRLGRNEVIDHSYDVNASHHALILDATVTGEGILRGGSGLELIVTAELVYVGTEELLLPRLKPSGDQRRIDPDAWESFEVQDAERKKPITARPRRHCDRHTAAD